MGSVNPAGVERALAAAVGSDHVHHDLEARRAASADYSWLSPILRDDLAGSLADVVARPGSAAEVARVLEVAFAHGIAVTPRGRGTGNYGQAVPLAGGIVVDLSRLDRVLAVGDGWITAEAGATFVDLEAAARRHGQELAMFPSTTRSTLGGFLCGGAGGTGSVAHGFIWDGYVHALEVAGCLGDVALRWTAGTEEVAPYLHAFGTTGVVTAAAVRLVPARPWTALLASFAVWEDALAAAATLMEREPLPRNVAVDDASLVGLLPQDRAMPGGRVSLRAIVDGRDVPEASRIVAGAGGRTEAVRPDGVARLVSLSYNHVTLRAVRARPSLCHLQVGGPPLASRAEEVRACLPGGMLHVDGQRRGAAAWFGGLLLSEFRDRGTLAAGARRLRELGVAVVDPHTFLLGAHADLPALRANAQVNDPRGLLNPGKLPPAPGHASGGAGGD